jgi:hypothetical protein
VQAKLQVPQLLMSLVVSTQLPLQSVEPPGQPNTHPPWEQESPTAQVAPQPPQFLGSVAVLTQVLPHWVSGGWHIGGVTHCWFWQTWPEVQQEPLQRISPEGQTSVQVPDWQFWFAPQVRLQPPQLELLELVSTQTPLQFVNPAAHPEMQLPWLQKVPVPQTLPQLPQLELSDDGSVHALPQNNWPVGQAQFPPLQSSPVPHAWAHDPQFWGSVWRFTQAFEQLVSLLPQFDWQSDPLHTGVGLLQAWPQLPQLFALLVRLTQIPLQLVSPFGHVATQPPFWHA